MQWHPVKQGKVGCHCRVDVTEVSTVRESFRGRPPRRVRSRMVRHYRAEDEAHFWHWEDLADRLADT